MPKFILTVTVTVEYIINVDSQVMKWKIRYTIVTPTGTYHALTEYSHSILGDLATGAYVMFLKNHDEYK